MKKLLFFLGLLLAGNTAFAQDYAPLPDTGIRRYFTNSAGYLRGIRVDSVVQENGYKRYVTFRTPRGRNPNSGDFTDSIGACWVGKNVRAYSNGDWQFPNEGNDTLLIKAGASLNDTWIFYNDTSSRWFEARVKSRDTQTVFGVLDSVKTIELTAMVGNTPLPADSLSGFQIVLSKTHGFAQVPDLYLFPYKGASFNMYSSDIRYDRMFGRVRELFGPPAAPRYEQLLFRNIVDWNPTQRQLFDCSIGDIFLYRNKGETGINYRYQHFKLDSFIAKSMYADSTVYLLSNGRTLSLGNALVFDTTKMPEEYISTYSNYVNNTIYIFSNDFGYCTNTTAFTKISGLVRGLYVNPFNYPTTTKYKGGLGTVYRFNGGGDGSFDEDQIIAYRKGTLSCGNFLVGIQDHFSRSSHLALYPQPAGNTVYLEAPQLRYPAIIRIQNLQGQLLSTQELQSAGKAISTAYLPGGLYLLSVTDASGNSTVQKLLIEAN